MEEVALKSHLDMLSHHHEIDFRASSLAQRLLRFSSGRRVLDAGCGTGRLTLELLRNGYDVVAIDHEEEIRCQTNLFDIGRPTRLDVTKEHGAECTIC